MTATFALLGLAGLLGTVGATRLSVARWPTRAPTLGVIAWISLLFAIFLSPLLAAVALVAPKVPGEFKLAAAVHSCSAAVIGHSGRHPDSVLTVVGTLTAASSARSR